MGNSIKDKTIKGLFWSAIDKVSFEVIQFAIGIVMARLLLPSDYGIIGIMMVFITFSTIFIEGGLTTALIQKNDRSDADYNTAFIYNIVIASFIYIILFLASPFIADFYDQPLITSLLRVLSLNLLISCFSSIQNTRLVTSVDFKSISKASVSSSLISGAIGITCAYNGLGVWSLVIQQISSNVIRCLILTYCTKWFPGFLFSWASFRYLFSFGSKLVLTNILARIYTSLSPLIIGKLYTAETLGFYTRGHQFSHLLASIMKDLFARVSFPILSSIKNEDERLKKAYRIYIEMSSFVIFPLFFILIVAAYPLILFMLTEKWIQCVPFLQITSLGLMFAHISSINLNLLFVKGRSDLALKLEVLKKTIAISMLIISSMFGVWGICIGLAIYELIATFLNSIYTRKLIGLSYRIQLSDFGKIWLVSAGSAILPYCLSTYISIPVFSVVLTILLYIALYIALNFMFKTKAMSLFLATSKEYYAKFKNR